MCIQFLFEKQKIVTRLSNLEWVWVLDSGSTWDSKGPMAKHLKIKIQNNEVTTRSWPEIVNQLTG